MTRSSDALRRAALVSLALFVVSFFLPTVEPAFESPATPGWKAFWMSLTSWGDIENWDASAIPLVGAWLASVGALLGAFVVLRRQPPRAVPGPLPLALALLGLGPLFSAPRELMIGYFVWLSACLALGLLAVMRLRRDRVPGR